MGLLNAAFIILGLSLDNFVLMMDKGATMRKLELKKALLYSFAYSVAAVLLLLVGYVASFLFKDMLSATAELSIATIIIFTIGVYIFVKSVKRNAQEEHVDDSFNIKSCFKIALITNIDTFCLGVGLSFSEVTILNGAILIFLFSFVIVLLAQYIGYTQGAKYTRLLGVSGGLLIIVFSIMMYTKLLGL